MFSSLQATPTRKSIPASSRRASGFLGVNLPDYGSYLPSSPLQQHHSSSQPTNAVPESAAKLPAILPRDNGVEDTPIKKKSNGTHIHPSGISSDGDKENRRTDDGNKDIGPRQRIEKFQQDSIYKSLGWDDADDFDELA
jgi:DNA replication regulator SLD3